MKQSRPAIDYFNDLAEHYDDLAASGTFRWNSPNVLYGMMADHVRGCRTLLDIGIGTGLGSAPFAADGMSVTGIDGCRKMLDICERKQIADRLVLKDLTDPSLPFGDETFDAVISCGVMYLMRDLENITDEVRRVCRTNGIFAFDVETREGNEHRRYIERDGAYVAEDALNATGICEYRHDAPAVEDMLKRRRWEILRTLNYHSYTSPSIRKDVYFTAFVARKTPA